MRAIATAMPSCEKALFYKGFTRFLIFEKCQKVSDSCSLGQPIRTLDTPFQAAAAQRQMQLLFFPPYAAWIA
jgi:hypothetical protein